MVKPYWPGVAYHGTIAALTAVLMVAARPASAKPTHPSAPAGDLVVRSITVVDADGRTRLLITALVDGGQVSLFGDDGAKAFLATQAGTGALRLTAPGATRPSAAFAISARGNAGFTFVDADRRQTTVTADALVGAVK